MSEQVTGQSLHALVDASNGLDGLCFLKRASLVQILLWQKLYAYEGKTTFRLDLMETGELQYLYWNSTKTPPADDKQVLLAACEELAQQIPVDETSEQELTSKLPPLSTTLTKKENVMGQGSATDGAIEKGASKKKSSKKGAAASEGNGAEASAPKVAKVKDPNGRPAEGTATGKVWAIADKLAGDNKNVTPTRAAVIEAAVAAGINKATAGVQYGAWFKGMKRLPAPPVEKAAEKEKAEAAS